MRWFILTVVVIAAFLTMGFIVQEDKFTIKVYDWRGIDSDEPFSPDLTAPVDMMNFDVGSEGGRTYIQQREGLKNIFEDPPGTEIRLAYICQIDSDTERVIIIQGGSAYFNTGHGDGWIDFDEGRPVDDGVNMTALLFKDTLIFTSGSKIFTAESSSDTTLKVDSMWTWPYRRILLHNDRIYGYGVTDATNTKLHWRPEFDIVFDQVDTKDNSGFVYIDRDAGDIITNLLPLGSHLVAYMTRAVYKVLISPTSNVPVEVIKVADNIGAYGYGAAIQWNNIHFFRAENGIYSFDGTAVSKISGPIDFWFADSVVQSVGTAKVFKMAVVNNRLMVTLPLRGGTGNESKVKEYRTFVYDLDLKVWWKYQLTSVTPSLGLAESHFMLRYEYSGRASEPLLGSINYGQRLIFVRDSVTGNHDRFYMHPGGTYKSDFGTVAKAHYVSALSPLNEMWQRKQFERVFTYSSALATDTFSIIWYGDANTALDTTSIITTATPGLDNKRLRDKVVGSLLKFRIEVNDSLRVKINALEIRGSMKGLADDTE